jgi:UDP-N-acetylmuramyl pentapeptide phosphotransferase/UDP-N-acetylglucosamine-1-phosphate transferase
MSLYFVIFIFLILIILGYFKLADHFNIIDKPNERSSHSHITIRGGGIIFPAAAFLWFLMFGFGEPWIILALMLLAVVSILDDAISLSSGIRIIIHFTAVALLFWQLNVFNLPWYVIVLAFMFTIGWINAFNFMDGINAITAFYGLVALLSFAFLNRSIEFIPRDLIILLTLSVIVFSFFNAKKQAKTFAGDVGSVSMAFLLAWFMISLMIKTGRIEYILFFAIYGIDSVITILYRLSRRENIFKAHRTHLFQYLSNEIKLPHIIVSVIYSVLQAIINIMTIKLIDGEIMTWPLFFIIFLVLSIVYLIVRYIVLNSAQQKSLLKKDVFSQS